MVTRSGDLTCVGVVVTGTAFKSVAPLRAMPVALLGTFSEAEFQPLSSPKHSSPLQMLLPFCELRRDDNILK